MLLAPAGRVPVPTPLTVIQRASDVVPSCVDRTLHLSEPGTYTRLARGQVGAGPESNDMISVAVKVHLNTETNVKVTMTCRRDFLL